MKEEINIRLNLKTKIALWKIGVNQKDRDKLKEHIRMLDWVLNDGNIRDIDTIINEAYQ